ncbi:MAG: hypothetical protein ACXVZX_09385 [Terriglobales bacterium]
MPAVQPTIEVLDFLLTRLHEAHEVSVYAAIERLMEGGEAVGFHADKLVRMLDRGVSLEELFRLIESEMECVQQSEEAASQAKRAA